MRFWGGIGCFDSMKYSPHRRRKSEFTASASPHSFTRASPVRPTYFFFFTLLKFRRFDSGLLIILRNCRVQRHRPRLWANRQREDIHVRPLSYLTECLVREEYIPFASLLCVVLTRAGWGAPIRPSLLTTLTSASCQGILGIHGFVMRGIMKDEMAVDYSFFVPSPRPG